MITSDPSADWTMSRLQDGGQKPAHGTRTLYCQRRRGTRVLSGCPRKKPYQSRSQGAACESSVRLNLQDCSQSVVGCHAPVASKRLPLSGHCPLEYRAGAKSSAKPSAEGRATCSRSGTRKMNKWQTKLSTPLPSTQQRQPQHTHGIRERLPAYSGMVQDHLMSPLIV